MSAAVIFVSLSVTAAAAYAARPFSGLSGTWSGAGQFRLENGKTERIRCSANYVPRSSGLGLSLRCASASNRVELRASLTSRGDRVSGTWEERSYNASGRVSGIAIGDTLRLRIDGGGLAGTMLVRTTGGSQSISVRTDTTALKGVNISLRRQ
jgi:hypothetical protein